MNNICVSVIIPAYNAQDYVVECLDSILCGYDTDDVEVIAVNDGSKDNTSTLLHQYAARDPRVIVIDKPNGGVSSARNAALDVARGKWLTFADADDTFRPDALRTILETIKAHEDADMIVGSSMVLKDGVSAPLITFGDRTATNPIGELKHFALWCYALKRSIIERERLRFDTDLGFSEDRVFLCRYALCANTIVSISQSLYSYRIHGGQVNKTQSALRQGSHELSAAKAIDMLMEKCTDDTQRDAIRRHRDFTVKIALLHFGKQGHARGEYKTFFDHYKHLDIRGMSVTKAKAYYAYRTLRTKLARLLGRS